MKEDGFQVFTFQITFPLFIEQLFTLSTTSVRQISEGCDWNFSIDRRDVAACDSMECTVDTVVATPNTKIIGISLPCSLKKNSKIIRYSRIV